LDGLYVFLLSTNMVPMALPMTLNCAVGMGSRTSAVLLLWDWYSKGFWELTVKDRCNLRT